MSVTRLIISSAPLRNEKGSCTYPARAAVAVDVLLKLLHTFVEVVVVVRAHVDENAMAENFTQVLLACPVVCDVTRKVERLPVLDSLMVDLSGDFVPWLPNMSVDVADARCTMDRFFSPREGSRSDPVRRRLRSRHYSR